MRFFYTFLSIIAMYGWVAGQAFHGTTGNIADDVTTTTFTCEVSGLPSSMNSVTFGIEQVCVDISHTWDSDLIIKLQSPSGRIVTLIEGAGGDSDDFKNTCLSGSNKNDIFHGWGPFSGTYRPSGDMGLFNDGSNPNGTWKLLILDVYPEDPGKLSSWEIQFGSNPSKPYLFESSALPIIKIDTYGQSIPDDPKIPASFKIISNDNGALNYVNDTVYSYSGNIGIEIRGSSSQSFPKKSFGLELWDENGEDIKASVLGMPKESDWVLNAHYTDKTLFRNNMTYKLFSEMGHYASRTQLVELFINGEYRGVYTFMEKIKRDKNRVDIPKLSENDTSGMALTGGYIFKIDRINGSGTDGWTSKFEIPGRPFEYTNFLFEYPKDDKINNAQKAYIESFVDSFETALHSDDFQNPVNGWRKYADELSFMDFMLIQEMSKNVDAYRLSTFMYKTRADADNKIHFGPVWDFDIAWFNANYCETARPDGWVFNINFICPDGRSPFWWSKILTDTTFARNMRCRWESLRQTTLSEDHIASIIDGFVAEMQGAENHNFDRWPILGIWVWPNTDPIPTTYQGEIDKLKGWIHQRFEWMDHAIRALSPDISLSINATNDSGLKWHFTPNIDLEGEYKWDFGDGSTSSDVKPDHVFSASGTYTVTLTYTNGFGCTESVTLTVNVEHSANYGFGDTGVSIFPNPATETISLKTALAFESGNYQISDVHGRKMQSGKILNSGENNIAIGALHPGVYILSLKIDNRAIQQRLVKM